MAVITILKTLNAILKDVILADQDKHGGGHSEVYLDLAQAMWYIDSATKRLQEESSCPP